MDENGLKITVSKGKFGWELIVDDLKDEVARLNDVITEDKQDIKYLKSELKVKSALVRDLTNATDTWSHHFNELDELAQANIKELENLRLKNTQLKATRGI